MAIPIQEFYSTVFATTVVLLAHPKRPNDLFLLGHRALAAHLPVLQIQWLEEISDPRSAGFLGTRDLGS